MGLRGPAPKPRALAVLEGNPGKRPLNRHEPQPRVTRPKCPDYLDEAAQREWKRLVPILSRMRVLTEADGIALANLCQQYSLLQQAQSKLQKTGLLLKTKSGYVQPSPLVTIVALRRSGQQTLPGVRPNPCLQNSYSGPPGQRRLPADPRRSAAGRRG